MGRLDLVRRRVEGSKCKVKVGQPPYVDLGRANRVETTFPDVPGLVVCDFPSIRCPALRVAFLRCNDLTATVAFLTRCHLTFFVGVTAVDLFCLGHDQ